MKHLRYWYTKSPFFDIKIVYYYVIEFSDSESNLGLHDKSLVSKIYPQNPQNY